MARWRTLILFVRQSTFNHAVLSSRRPLPLSVMQPFLKLFLAVALKRFLSPSLFLSAGSPLGRWITTSPSSTHWLSKACCSLLDCFSFPFSPCTKKFSQSVSCFHSSLVFLSYSPSYSKCTHWTDLFSPNVAKDLGEHLNLDTVDPCDGNVKCSSWSWSFLLSVFNLQLSFPSGVLLGTHLFLLSLGLPLLNNIPLNSCTLACMLLWLPTLPLLMTPSCFFISTHVSHLLFSTFLSHTYFLHVVHLFMFSPLYLSLDSPPSSVHHLQSFQPSPSVSPSLEAPPPPPPLILLLWKCFVLICSQMV